MAKGKHHPAAGAVRKTKVVHPNSRKAAKLHSQEHRKLKVKSQQKVGAVRLQALGAKLLWFHDNLSAVLAEDELICPKEGLLMLIQGYLQRFADDLAQLELRGCMGGNANIHRHANRKDLMRHTIQLEEEEFNRGCGVEVPDLLDRDNLKYFQAWNGEHRFVQNIRLRRYRRADLVCPSALDASSPTA